jgi:hypothetical protein
MVEQVTFQTLFQFLQTVGILVGVFYYIMTIRTNQRNQELTMGAQEQALETRQAQLLSSFMGMLLTSDSLYYAMMYWNDHPEIGYEEFKEQYPRGSEGFQDLFRLFGFYELIGTLSKWKLVDEELVDDMFTLQWDKFEPIVKGMQEDWGDTGWWENYEWLAKARQKARNAQKS